MERIVIKVVGMPNDGDPDRMIKWFCEVFDLSNGKDNDNIEEQILKRFILNQGNGDGLSSSQLNADLETHLARSTLIYHLNRFIDAGLLVRKGRRYHLRANELSKTIEELEYDIDREMKRLHHVAEEFERIMLSPRQPRRLRGGD
ncbi:MAG: hypothetical protein KGH98_02850 [Candidatus Micrarchaeota archaeon]|nr:hypothetical protein [Candidatus Micrarchaeota archaeon]